LSAQDQLEKVGFDKKEEGGREDLAMKWVLVKCRIKIKGVWKCFCVTHCSNEKNYW